MRSPSTIPFPERHEAPRTVEGPDGKQRYADGWRVGKPVEDPNKTKTWGFIAAQPSEYLIHMRRGQVLKRSSGQGASCFKLPWDSVALIPTTIARLQFTADQVTREKVGVQVTGLAVYRITDPEMTYKMLNFSFAERASEKLESILREMFMGSVRRIVANMSVEEVMTRRKEGLAEEIVSEIAPIITGRGREQDRTNRGWGVVIDTIEIQDVRVLSEKVFANMQAVFRNELMLRARTAELTTSKEISEKETKNAREIAEAKITAEAATRELKAKAESKAAEIEVAEGMKREKLKSAAERAKLAEQEALEQQAIAKAARIATEKKATEQAALLASVEAERLAALAQAEKERDAEMARLAREQVVVEGQRKVEDTKSLAARESAQHAAELEHWQAQSKIELERSMTEAQLAKERLEAEAWAARREREVALERLAGDSANELALGARQIENLISDEAIRRDMVLKALPALAEAFAQNFGEMRFLQIGDGGKDGADPLAFIGKAFAQVMEIAKASGLKLGEGNGKPPASPAPDGE